MSSQSPLRDVVLKLNPFVEASSTSSPMPSNRELLSSLEHLRAVLRDQRINNEELDDKGKAISNAIENFLQTSESFVKAKNPDEAVQRFAEHVISFGEKAAREAELNKDRIENKADASTDRLSNIANNLKRLVQQIFSSSDARAMLHEVESFITKIQKIIEENHGTVSNKEGDKNKKANEKKASKLTDLSKETRKDLVRGLLSVFSKIGTCQASKDMRHDILSLYDYWSGTKEDITTELQQDFNKLFDEGLELVNRFTNKDLEVLKKKWNQAYTTIENDSETREFISSMRKFTDKIVDHPEIADREDMVKEGDDIIDKALQVLDKHYDTFNPLFDELREILHSLQEEKYLKQYKDNIAEVGECLKGSYLDNIVQVRTLMIPIIGETLKEVKLPSTHDADSTGTWSIENITLAGKESSLDDVSLDFKIGLKDLIKVTLKIKHVDVTLKGVNFTYNRTALPAWNDRGVIDIRLYSPAWRIKWIAKQQKGKEPYFELSQADAKIKRLDINIIEADHSWVDSLLIPIWTPSLRKRAQESIEKMLVDKAFPLTDKLNEVFANSKENPIIKVKQCEKVIKTDSGSGETHPAAPKELHCI